MKAKFMNIPFFLTMIAILLSRVYQLIFIKDSVARSNWNTIEIALFAIAAISVLVMFILSIRPKGVIFYFSFGKSTSTGIIGLLSSFLIVFHSIYKLFQYINEDRDIMHLLLGILGVATGIILIFMSISFINGKVPFEHRGILTLIPVIWGIFRLLELFFTYYSTSNKIWAVPDEFAAIFLLLFLLNLAKSLAKLNNHKDLVKLIFCGLSSVIFTFNYTTLGFINKVLSTGTILTSSSITLIMDLLLAAYIIMIINSIKLEKETNHQSTKEENIVESKPLKTDSENTDAMNMSQINQLVDTIKNESV
ncbi:MAG: hypothetical protein RUMPE_00012 [Eubacteriales bacterium SKADARSKE-1]|nr:hypothetical protein [Eubacteriales bacterium SKADARSKE-1]